ncbi:MAG: sigma 54-interacting transcriptional regulator [Deltaproteobacteria bacterium]|nr:sigma 54-interacting transcriptional regulator [Deltaproteobacteria bacterium]
MPRKNPQLETILNSIADGVFTINLDREITSFNRSAERITGVKREQAIGQKCFDVFHANICQGRCAMEKTLKTGTSMIDLPVSILNIRGKTVPISISTAVLKNDRGETVGGVETFRDLSAIEDMRRELARQYSFGDIISKNHEIVNLFGVLPDIAQSSSTVLIQGASGTGKELFALAIHNCSTRAEGPYVAVNCGALPSTLLESELFGYCKGAFTDAKLDKPGRFARARGGTLFLDEIGDLPLPLQVKLLRVLQEGEYEPLGATKPVTSDARIIAATNRDLASLMAEGKFREDLYYRINVIKLFLPTLAQRREDIPLLVEHFIDRFNARTGRRITGVSPEVLRLFMHYGFPGNIRQLENIIEHAFVLCRGTIITPEHLPADILAINARPAAVPGSDEAFSFKKAEAQVILDTLKKYGNHRGNTARELGIDKATLWRKMKRLGITA